MRGARQIGLELFRVPMLKRIAMQVGTTMSGTKEELIERILLREDRLWENGIPVPGTGSPRERFWDNGLPVPKAAGPPVPADTFGEGPTAAEFARLNLPFGWDPETQRVTEPPGPAAPMRTRPTPAQLRYVAGAARRQGLVVPPQVYEDREECSRWLDRHGDWNQ
jgi:hypothetical protein